MCWQESVWQVGEDPPLLLFPPDGIHLCILWKLFPSDFFLLLAQKIFCSHCVLTVFQPLKLCYYPLWQDMAWLVWIDLTYPLNSNCYCSLHTVTESLDQKSAGPRVMCEKRKVLTFQAWVSVHLTLWGSHARWRVAFIVTKTNAGQTDRLTWTFQVCASIVLS